MPTDRLVFGDPPPPLDPSLCASLVPGRDGDVLTQDVCSHPRRQHEGKGNGCRLCACRGFTTPRAR